MITSILLFFLPLSSAVAGTIAWFTAQRSVTVQAGSFQVTTPEGQDADIYYHSLNYNDTLKQYAGFEKSSLMDENYSSFKKVDKEDTTTPSPLDTNYLWPNFQLTYALVFTPIRTGTYTFRLKSWKSDASTEKLVSEGKGIRLSWAIRMYSYAVEDDETFSKAKEYFSSNQSESFFSSTSADSSDTMEQGNLTYEVTDTSKSVVVYFTIEFSNDSSTYYELDESTKYWNASTTSSTQSMCYENLTFNAEKFVLDIPAEQP